MILSVDPIHLTGYCMFLTLLYTLRVLAVSTLVVFLVKLGVHAGPKYLKIAKTVLNLPDEPPAPVDDGGVVEPARRPPAAAAPPPKPILWPITEFLVEFVVPTFPRNIANVMEEFPMASEAHVAFTIIINILTFLVVGEMITAVLEEYFIPEGCYMEMVQRSVLWLISS